MNTTEHLLVCLAEECDEVGQRASKALRFGLSEIQPGQPHSNAERISEEIKDMISVAVVLQKLGIIPRCLPEPEEITAKRDKIEHFMEISRREGVLSDV